MNKDEKIIYNMVDNFVDFPNKYSLTLFFNGCNLNCPFCYNKHVVNGEGVFSINDVLERKNRIENSLGKMNIGLVFSGGEPTVHPYFEEVINTFRSNPLSIHTNGIILPEMQNPFDAVVLSLKPSDCGVPADYLDRLEDAMLYYGNCKVKHINVVKIDKYLDEYSHFLSELEHIISHTGFEIKFVEYFSGE